MTSCIKQWLTQKNASDSTKLPRGEGLQMRHLLNSHGVKDYKCGIYFCRLKLGLWSFGSIPSVGLIWSNIYLK
nr:hypothetical protein [Tanacetum cinerariifolium]